MIFNLLVLKALARMCILHRACDRGTKGLKATSLEGSFRHIFSSDIIGDFCILSCFVYNNNAIFCSDAQICLLGWAAFGLKRIQLDSGPPRNYHKMLLVWGRRDHFIKQTTTLSPPPPPPSLGRSNCSCEHDPGRCWAGQVPGSPLSAYPTKDVGPGAAEAGSRVSSPAVQLGRAEV